jgi:predicted lipoprotein with Yx(FWY)xxD motif
MHQAIMTKTRLWALTALLLLLNACATAGGGAPVKVSDGVFSNEAGMSLYTFDRDVAGSGKSVCNGPCAGNWPPLLAGADARASGDWSIVTRDDGARQWAYKGKPVYLWAKDTKPGDRTGQGVNNVWQLARP